ncbi:MAG: GTPase, partial [Candidatus Aenigmatarchaeota archaeon]
MPTNVTPEYLKAVRRFENTKTDEERILACEDVITNVPSHKGCETLRAQWKTRLAKLRKDAEKKKTSGAGKKTTGVKKEGDAQVCVLGFANSGKSTLLNRLTDAHARIADYEYTTTKPEIGMMDYKGVKIQLVEIPAIMTPEFMSIARSASALVLLAKSERDKLRLEEIREKNFLKQPYIFMSHDDRNAKEKIWGMLDMIIVYTQTLEKNRKKRSPMALR